MQITIVTIKKQMPIQKHVKHVLWSFNTQPLSIYPLQYPVDLVTFTEEIHNGKLYFLCSE